MELKYLNDFCIQFSTTVDNTVFKLFVFENFKRFKSVAAHWHILSNKNLMIWEKKR
jgi:hypothetical protein